MFSPLQTPCWPMEALRLRSS
ncbi:hypothetical protein EYF80_063849 [Liparis tanakae]|uniref:Uncharacterized protein n=1 Tax=Liparis tanakae TaxID=230148 RepID=A0A4Z2EB93_9TELE|nr:hypothetical protein EYF80_063849 [Liparis tanakae]